MKMLEVRPELGTQKYRPGAGAMEAVFVGFWRKKGQVRGLHLQGRLGKCKLRVAKALRGPLEAELQTGMMVRVWVDRKRRASMVLPLLPRPTGDVAGCNPTACRASKILVCNSKSCCRRGGGERLLAAIEQAVEGRHDVCVEKCGCLKACGKGPNIKIGGECISRLEACQIPDLLGRLLPVTSSAAAGRG